MARGARIFVCVFKPGAFGVAAGPAFLLQNVSLMGAAHGAAPAGGLLLMHGAPS